MWVYFIRKYFISIGTFLREVRKADKPWSKIEELFSLIEIDVKEVLYFDFVPKKFLTKEILGITYIEYSSTCT